MPRPRNNAVSSSVPAPAQMVSWAESLGEALGRGVAKGINLGLANVVAARPASANALVTAPRRGRPPKSATGGPVPAEKLCKVEGCGRPARSKGLCSAHYQAERRRLQAKTAGK